MNTTIQPTVLLVPGLRDHVEQHWQTLLAADLPRAVTIAPMGRANLDCRARVEAIEQAANSIRGPLVIVAHSAGCLMVVHWAQRTRRAVAGALLAAPPDFERPMPEGYPAIEELAANGWLPVPRTRLPFRSIVGASRNDPLASYACASALAQDWGSELVDLGEVGHLNPSSGFGPWPPAHDYIEQLAAAAPMRA
ncbi:MULTISPECIES: RBBP9/YdeN family alpha/beta hydrolase [Ramlibacter]|uniref:Alpha/beta hydrolase n=1 Tax=Ramlibacter pinisoli TaxID=2682844 RepID=A0A6N8ITM2_9BURK|nr:MULTISPECIES: alpha/beta hydrolase [Ramlibacter]MBA2965232.1 alpha/beta hydrolase [Ramlibacter sp. CGMCC 1.13660]MVQ30197.1 alpha/beta hydrolase [Ramlibacter pinisoli]